MHRGRGQAAKKAFICGTCTARSWICSDFHLRRARWVPQFSRNREVVLKQANRERGAVIWFTGLSGSGKTTIAHVVEEKLLDAGVPVEILDGDVVRENLSKGLGFSKEDRDTNIRRIAFVGHLLQRNGTFVITAAIS